MKRVLFCVFVLALFGACNPKQSRQRNVIASEEKTLMEQAKTGKIDSAALNTLLKDYEDFAAKYPEDTIGATYLFKAADFYRYLRKPLRSIDLYDKIYKNYPTSDKKPYALFLQGFTYENDAANTHAAKALYEQFLKEYPNHVLAKDVRVTLTNLGKSPEQLIAEFQEKARQDSLAKAAK
jgi:TolA-binding protein